MHIFLRKVRFFTTQQDLTQALFSVSIWLVFKQTLKFLKELPPSNDGDNVDTDDDIGDNTDDNFDDISRSGAVLWNNIMEQYYGTVSWNSIMSSIMMTYLGVEQWCS